MSESNHVRHLALGITYDPRCDICVEDRADLPKRWRPIKPDDELKHRRRVRRSKRAGEMDK